MKVLVFAKQIPDVNKITFDPVTLRIRRENVPLEMNSFDSKAVEEAIRISEKFHWETAVATMGPPQAGDIINKSMMMGIGKGYLLTDRAFAGSDTLVTSRVLARFLELTMPDLVLMGKYSLDGETSQVPPEVATFAGYNFKSSISRIDIESGNSCIVEHENEQGMTEYRIRLPAVLSLSEKINRARGITAGTPDMHGKIETMDEAVLGTGIVGARDSPTVVAGTDKVESGRKVSFLPFDKNVYGKVMDLIAEGESKQDASRRIELGDYTPLRDAIWGVAVDDVPLSIEISCLISELGLRSDLNVIMAGNVRPDKLHGMICHKYYFIDAAETDALSGELVKLMKAENPAHVVLPSTVAGREVSGLSAAALNLGLTADCIDLAIQNGKMIQYKPAFGGGIVATITSKTRPSMATVRPGMFRISPGNSTFETIEVPGEHRSRIERLKHTPVPTEFRPLRSSRLVIGIGRGLKYREKVVPVVSLAEKLSASVGGTRPIVDMNWIPRQQQIGLTGASISPAIYIALGVSGRDNHVVGIRYAGKVIAVNTDRNAPIFGYADIGIVADANEFVAGFHDYLSPGT